MKASELIERLNAIIAEHGDLPVCNERMDRYEECCLYDVESVVVREDVDELTSVYTDEKHDKYIDLW